MNKSFCCIGIAFCFSVLGCSDCRSPKGMPEISLCYSEYSRNQRLVLRGSVVVEGVGGIMFSQSHIVGNADSQKNHSHGNSYFLIDLENGSLSWMSLPELNKALTKLGYRLYDMRHEVNIFDLRGEGYIGKNPSLIRK